MSRTTSPTPLRPQVLDIRLPPLHEGQRAVAEDPARFKVVVCGRQWGKTLVGACMAIRQAAAGGDVWWVAPSFPIGELGWYHVDHLARQIPGCRFEGRPVWRITLPSGGTIQLRSADNPDSLRGATLDGVVFDEAAQAKPEAWPTLRPTLSVRGGWALFISTPRGLNWFRDLYDDAQHLEDWATWRFPSLNSPFQRPDEIAKSRREMSPVEFAQELQAEFVSTNAAGFRSDWIQHYRTRFDDQGERVFLLGDHEVRASACRVIQTADIAFATGKRNDYTVISTWAITPKAHLLLLDVDRGHYEAPDIVKHFVIAYHRWTPMRVGIERAQRSWKIIEDVAREGLPVHELKADKAKEIRAGPAQMRMERGTVWFPPMVTPWMPDILEEVLAFPHGRHDDFVDTLAYAVLELAKRSGYEDHGLRTV